MTLNYENLSRDLGRNKRTIMKYFHYLRFSILVDLVPNFKPSLMASSRKNKKVYPTTPSLAYSSLPGRAMDDEFLGRLLETFVSSELEVSYYF